MITFTDAAVRFGPTEVMQPFSTTWSSGETVALIGPNGSGKTTLLRLASGLSKPSSGSVERSPHTTISYVAQHQDHHKWMPLTVSELMKMSRYSRRGLIRRFSADDRAAIIDAIEEMAIGDLQSKFVSELSGGQRQRVQIAKAIANDADVVLLDEPLTGLDVVSQKRIYDAIDRMQQQQKLVVLSTHDLVEAHQLQTTMLLAGRVIASGPSVDVLTEAHLIEAFGSSVLLHDGMISLVDDHGHGDVHGHSHASGSIHNVEHSHEQGDVVAG